MRHRLDGLIDERGRDVTMGTFHSSAPASCATTSTI